MARTCSAEHDAQKDRIMDIAVEMFACSSYASTSMMDLAASMGNSKARIYHYYRSKDAILFDLLDRYTLRLLDRATEVAMLFGAMNWTFMWLKPDGDISYSVFAEHVLNVFEGGLAGVNARPFQPCLRARTEDAISDAVATERCETVHG